LKHPSHEIIPLKQKISGHGMDQAARHERVPAGHAQLPHREPVDAGPDAAPPPPSRHPGLPARPGRRPPTTH
jgi:hypothetical protein